MANRISKGLLSKDEKFESYSILGSKFEATVIETGQLKDGKPFIRPWDSFPETSNIQYV